MQVGDQGPDRSSGSCAGDQPGEAEVVGAALDVRVVGSSSSSATTSSWVCGTPAPSAAR